MSFYKLAKARTAELERPEKKLRTDYGESKRVDVAKYHDELTKGKVKQNYDSLKSQHHDKINHSDYLISQTNLGKTDLLKNKLLSERMAQLNATKYESVQEVDINLGIGSDNAVVQEVNQVIGDFIQKISSGVFDLTMTNDLYKLYKLIQTQTYKFGSDLLERYKSYFEDVKETLDLDETADVVRSYSRKDSSVLKLMKTIVMNSIKIINKMLEAILSGKSSEERKQILEQDVKNITFKKIDTTYLKELSKEIKTIEEEMKTAKQEKMGGQFLLLQQQLDELQVIKKTLKDVEWNTKDPQEKASIKFQEYELQQNYEQMQRDQQEEERQKLLRQEAELQRRLKEERRKQEDRQMMGEEDERSAKIEKMEKLKEQSIVLENQNDIITEYLRGLERNYTSLRTQVLRFVDGKQADKFNRLNNYRQGLEKGKENQAFYNALKSKPDFLALRQNILDQQEYNRQLDAVQAEYIRVSNELDALQRGGVPAEPKSTIDDKGAPEFKAEEADTVLDNLADIFNADTGMRVDDAIEPVDEFEIPEVPAPAPKPKKEDIVVADKLPYTTALTDTGTIRWNTISFRRTRSTFLRDNTKAEAKALLDTLGIDYKSWPLETQGTKSANVKAFKEKAYDEFLANPRLWTVRNARWFRE